MKILFVTDERISFLRELENRGHEVLVVNGKKSLKKIIKNFNPDDIHIMTFKPISFFTRRYFLKKRIPFKVHFLSLSFSQRYLLSFYAKATKIFAPTPGAKNLLLSYGINQPIEVLNPGIEEDFEKIIPLLEYCDKPIFVFHGELSSSSGASEFCEMPLPGTKIIITSDPLKGDLFRKFAKTILFYPLDRRLTASVFNAADVLVVPQTQEIFPVVLLEANARGAAVASRPVIGVKEYIRNGQNGYMSHDLISAALRSLNLKRQTCIDMAKVYTAKALVDNLLS